MSRKTQITLTDGQYRLLVKESHRSGLSMAELIRRALDATYRPGERPRVRGYAATLGFFKEPDVAVVGRPPYGRRLAD